MNEDIKKVLKNLNIFDRQKVINYIELEKEKLLSQANDRITEAQEELEKGLRLAAEEREKDLTEEDKKRWELIETHLHAVLRNNHIGQKRVEKIEDDLAKELQPYENKVYKNVDDIIQPNTGVKILTKDEFEDLLEWTIEGNCKNCKSRSSKCKLYKILKKYNIPYPSGHKGKCKYSYD